MHGIEKPSPAHVFRGFKKFDDKDTQEPVFKLPNEPDPVSTSSTVVSSSKSVKKNLFISPDNAEKEENKNAENIRPTTSNSEDINDDRDGDLKDDLTQAALDTIHESISTDKIPSPEAVMEKNSEAEQEESKEAEKEKKPEAEKEKKSHVFVEVEDEMCGSFERHLAESITQSSWAHDLEDDSDVDSGDEETFTFIRLRNKMDRYEKRNIPDKVLLYNVPVNKEFIDGFVTYLKKTAISQNPKNPIINASTSVLFRHEDSLLEYLTKKDPSFTLDRLLCFNDLQRFKNLKDPTSWIDQISGDDGRQNATRRKEMYKAYKRLARYILFHHGDTDFGTDFQAIYRRDKIKSDLKDIMEEIDDNKNWTKLKKIVEMDREEVLKAKETIDPDEKHKAGMANKTYFASEEFQKRVMSNNKIWEDCVSTGDSPGARNYDSVGNFTRHLLAMTDRNRSSGYKFKNSDFNARKKVWFPPGHNSEKFDGLPDGWNMYREPADGREADAWIIHLSASDEVLKLGESVNIIILKMAHEWCEKFRDIKMIKWDDLSQDEYFFTNNKRKPFGPMNNTAMLKEYEKVTGLSNVTTNTFRKAMEPMIQGDQRMKTRSKDISSHSEQTGSKYYDNSSQMFRASAMHFINDDEVSYEAETPVPENVAAKRRKLDAEGQKTSLDKAKAKIQKDPAKRNCTPGKNCKVISSDRWFLQRVFAEDGAFSNLKLHVGVFPGINYKHNSLAIITFSMLITGVSEFRRSFYRLVDGHEVDENIEMMRSIEDRVFRVVKKEDFGGSWDGSLKSNEKADLLVVTCIRNSFKVYEKNSKKSETFFSF